MVDNRKRSAPPADASDESDTEQAGQNVPADAVPKAAAPKLVPFASGAELHKALKTPSADLLRLLLSRFRAQTSLGFAQDQERSLIPASDSRIELVRDYCQLCMTDPSNSSSISSAANTIFSTWDLADKQSLPTLLHLPIFSLAQALALLSIHYPTQSLGEAIIDRILSANEPWFARLQTYISHLGGAKLASGKSKDAQSKGSDVAALAALVLLREINTFARGKYAGKVFDSFNWGMKVLPHIFTMRRRSQQNRKKARKAENKAVADASLRRPDIRTLYILFLLSFLVQSYSSSLKVRLLELGRDFLPAMLKGLSQDPADVVQVILVHLHEDLVKDDKISRSKKVEFWNEWACECVVKLYAREDDHVLIHADAEVGDTPSVAELAHHFLLSICTNPGFGICYPDRGWYPRKAADETVLEPTMAVDSLVDEIALTSGPKKASQSGSIHNKVLSGVLRQLSVTEDLRQQELALRVLQACPELVGPYLDSSCAGLSVEPRPSSRWLCNMAFFGRVVGLDLPSFRNAKVERLENTADDTASVDLFPANPPPMQTVLSNLLPGPFHRFLFSQGLSSPDRLVQYSTCTLLSGCLRRVAQFRAVCEDAIAALDEGSEGPWRKRLQAFEIEARKRLPDVSVVIQILQVATGQTSRSGSRTRASTVDTTDDASITSSDSAQNQLLTEVALRLLWLYYLGVPSSSHDVRFNAGKLLSNSFMLSTTLAKASSESEDAEALNLKALCQVHTLRILSLSSDTVFDWTAKANLGSSSGSNLCYLGLLLCLFVSTPLDQVREACEALLRRILSSSALFEHNPAEIDAWLSSLPHADRVNSLQNLATSAQTQTNGVELDHDFGVSQEQMQVIAFIDECVLRCMKTPYRYIEASRQYQATKENEEHDRASGSSLGGSVDLLASPLLMVSHEQFTIRVQKSLLETEAAGALLAFFARLLPCLAAYTFTTHALTALAREIQASISASVQYQASKFSSQVVLSRLLAVQIAPEVGSQVTPGTKRSSQAWNNLSTPGDLRRALRTAHRPLSSDDLAGLCDAVKQLSSKAFASASEILEELDPVTENVSRFLDPGQTIQSQHVPILHISSGQNVAELDTSPFAMTDDSGASPLVSWNNDVASRLMLWTAMHRIRKAAQDTSVNSDATIRQVSSMLRYVAESSGTFGQDSMRSYLFAEVTPRVFISLGQTPRSASMIAVLFQQICGFAHELDPTNASHQQMLEPMLRALLADWLWNSTEIGPPLATIAVLAPFMDVDLAVGIADRLLASLKKVHSSDILDALRMLLALFPSSGLLFAKVTQQAVELVQTGEANSSVIGLLHDLLSHNVGPSRNAMHQILAQGMQVLLSSEARDSNRDGLILELLQTNQSFAASVSAVMSTSIEQKPDAAQTLLRDLPYSTCAVLEALASQESGQAAWTEAKLQLLVQAAINMITSANKEDSASYDCQPIVASINHAVQYAKTQSWPSIGQSVTTDILGHIIACTPREAFSEPLLRLLLSLSTSKTQLPELPALTQKLVDQALLWLVRRFAEDDNDSVALVQSIKIFKQLLRAASPQKTQLSSHLVDPVVQAAVKNRLLAVRQLELVVELCSTSELSNNQLSRYLGAITAHPEFNSIMRQSATVLLPAAADDEEPADSETEASSRLRDVVVQLIHAIAIQDSKTLLQPALMSKLMTFYGASLHLADRRLLNLFRLFEEECGQPFMLLASRWSLPSSKLGGGGDSSSLMDALTSLDSNTVFATCTEYPRSMPLRRSTCSGYVEQGQHSLPGQVYGKHADLSQRYDPVFTMSLLAGLVGTQKLTGLEWLSVLATNVPGLAMCGLSSQHADMRQASFALLSQCYGSVQESNFQEKEHLLMIFDLLKDAVLSGVGQEEEEEGIVTPVLPSSTTLFVAHSLRSLASPSSFVYPAISHFMLQRPALDIGDVPMLYAFLYSASDRYRQERIWMLRFLRDVSRSGGRSDWKILKRRHTWELLASLYDSSTTSLDRGVSPERATEEAAVRALIEDTMFWLARHPDIATELVTRRNILSWIWQQLVHEGVVSPGATVGPPLRNTWLLLVAQLVSHADLYRLDRATKSIWRSSVFAIVCSSMRAIERLEARTDSETSSADGTKVQTTSIVYASALVMEKMIWHSVSSQSAEDDEAETRALSDHLLHSSLIEGVALLLRLSKQWLASFDNQARLTQDLKDARRCCKRVQNCILGLGASSPDNQSSQLAWLLRESVELCKVFDRETYTLLLTSVQAAQ